MKKIFYVLISLLFFAFSSFSQEFSYEGTWSNASNASNDKFDDEFTQIFLSISNIGSDYIVIFNNSDGYVQRGIARSSKNSNNIPGLMLDSSFLNKTDIPLFIKKSDSDGNYPNNWIDSIEIGSSQGDEWGPMYVFYRTGYFELHRTGKITADNVRYRKFPTTDDNYNGKGNEILGKYNKGQELEILLRSESKVKIGDMNDYWYMVKDVNDIPISITGWPYMYGWVYGAFLDIEE